MNLFKFSFQFLANTIAMWFQSDILLLLFYIAKVWVFIWFVAGLSFLIVIISFSLIFFQLLSIFFSHIFGYNSFKFSIPSLNIKQVYNYPELISNYFSINQGLQSEDFLPPFLFGYRSYFFARIIGWAGTWASYLRRHRRRIRSSIFEWGYKGRVPTYHYYVLRGGLRVHILVPNNFKRVTGSSYNSPTWVYSFPPRIRKLGFKDTIWDEDNWNSFGDTDQKRMFFISRVYQRPRYRNWKLSAWVEKWAPTLSPTYSKADYFSAIDLHSPYSYFNYFNSFPSGAHVSFWGKSSNFGFESKIAYRHQILKESINPKAMNYMNKLKKYREIDFKTWLKSERTFQEIGDYEIIDVKGIKIRKFKVAYTLYLDAPTQAAEFEHNNYFRFYLYHSILEFCTIFFESFYIYPFEFQNFFIDLVIKPNSFFSFKDIFDFIFILDGSIFPTYFAIYLIIAVLYFSFFFIIIYCFLNIILIFKKKN